MNNQQDQEKIEIFNTLHFPESQEQAAEYLRLVLTMLSRYGIPPNPLNYALCYLYQTGRSAKLRESLDEFFNVRGGLTENDARALFKKYVFDCDEQQLERYRIELLRITAETIGSLSDFVGKTNTSGNALEHHAEKLAAGHDVTDILKVVTEIISETRNVTNNTRTMETTLANSNDEVEHLRRELAKIKDQAITDGLTGILNRRAFDTELRELTRLYGTSGNTFSMLLLDIDHFKNINDTYGHLIGDKVLRSVAQLVVKVVKGRDRVARVGGEEFAVLLPATSLSGAIRVAEDIRESIAKAKLRRVDSGEVLTAVTVSIGVGVSRKSESPESLYDRCDKALYKAKRRGRNRCVEAR